MNYTLGIDVSHWQGTMNWQTAVNAGASFAFIRAGSHDASGPYTDWQFENNKNAGLLLPVGFYWYWRPQYSNDAQATHFHNLVKAVPWHLPPVIDVEDHGGLTAAGVANKLEVFVGLITSLFGRLPIIYTRQSFFDTYVASRLAWSTMDLWAARYERFLPGPWADGKYKFRDWNDWRFWQKSADKDYNGEGQPIGNFRGAEFGAESPHIDINDFQGDLAALAKYAGLLEPPPDLQPFPTEKAMPLRPVLLKDKVALQSDVALTGANNTGVALTVPNLPANVKALKLWLIVKADKPGAFVFFGPGAVGEQRFHFGARTQAVNLEVDEHGDVLLDGAKLWRQHNALGGTVRYWLFLTGYFVDAPEVDLTAMRTDIDAIYDWMDGVDGKNLSQDGAIGTLAGKVAAIEIKLSKVKEIL